MSFLDDLVGYGRSVYDWATGDSTSAQMVRDAGTGLAVHHLTGGSGEDNLGAMAGGAALGQGIRYFSGGPSAFNTTPAQTAATMQPQVSNWTPTASGNPNAFSTAVSNAAPAATGATFGAGVGDSIASGVGTAQTKLDELKKFGQKYPVLETAGKGLLYAKNYMDKQKVQDDMDRYAQQEDARIASDTALAGKANAQREASYSDAVAQRNVAIENAGNIAAGGVKAATARQLAGLNKNTGMSAGAKQAVARGISVSGAGEAADAHSRATLGAYNIGVPQAPTPEYGRSAVRTAGLDAAKYKRDGQREDLGNLYDIGREALGYPEKAAAERGGRSV